ncbi:hypothetical protein U9M48_009102 [Paspalum notatum var. saurae]|uniref:Uncharacterized protein n=1 Tax=Paspalum notatum var. saurae TaxID=547442 RepID=A0AAQ3SQX3_PASNO
MRREGSAQIKTRRNEDIAADRPRAEALRGQSSSSLSPTLASSSSSFSRCTGRAKPAASADLSVGSTGGGVESSDVNEDGSGGGSEGTSAELWRRGRWWRGRDGDAQVGREAGARAMAAWRRGCAFGRTTSCGGGNALGTGTDLGHKETVRQRRIYRWRQRRLRSSGRSPVRLVPRRRGC